MFSPQTLWQIETLSCCFMTGLIWLIQCVHYPSFRFIDSNRFSDFHQFHSTRITWIVAPVMGVELLSAIALFWEQAARSGVNLASVLLLWGITAFVSVPCHVKLESGFKQKWWRLLVLTNWSRTVLWSLRLILLVQTASFNCG